VGVDNDPNENWTPLMHEGHMLTAMHWQAASCILCAPKKVVHMTNCNAHWSEDDAKVVHFQEGKGHLQKLRPRIFNLACGCFVSTIVMLGFTLLDILRWEGLLLVEELWTVTGSIPVSSSFRKRTAIITSGVVTIH